MSEILPITEIGSPILRDRANSIVRREDPSLDRLIEDLIATAHAANGVGIAAPQVGNSIRLFIVASRPSPRYPHAPIMEPTAMINPKIISHIQELESGWEGCLSVPGVRGLVPRYREISVEYRDRQGQMIQQELTDFVARIFQHELDHLDGILFPDRVLDSDHLITEEQYQKLAFDR
jgi:peptide deformylase